MKNEVLQAILQLKDYDDDPKLQSIRKLLEGAVNKDILDSLSCIAMVGEVLGYNTVQKLMEDVSKVVDKLEQGKSNWRK